MLHAPCSGLQAPRSKQGHCGTASTIDERQRQNNVELMWDSKGLRGTTARSRSTPRPDTYLQTFRHSQSGLSFHSRIVCCSSVHNEFNRVCLLLTLPWLLCHVLLPSQLLRGPQTQTKPTSCCFLSLMAASTLYHFVTLLVYQVDSSAPSFFCILI